MRDLVRAPLLRLWMTLEDPKGSTLGESEAALFLAKGFGSATHATSPKLPDKVEVAFGGRSDTPYSDN